MSRANDVSKKIDEAYLGMFNLQGPFADGVISMWNEGASPIEIATQLAVTVGHVEQLLAEYETVQKKLGNDMDDDDSEE